MTKGNAPEFFYFDMGNVLLSFDYDVAARKMSEICGLSPEDCRAIAYGDELLLGLETGRISLPEFHQRFSEISNSKSDINALLDARANMFELMAPTVRVLTQLKGVRRRTGLLSNTSPDHFEYCRRRYGAIRDLFDVYVVSYEAGAMKPDSKIYEIAIEKAGVSPEQIFFVDDREENVAAARELGIDAVQFTDTSKLIDDLRERGVEFNL